MTELGDLDLRANEDPIEGEPGIPPSRPPVAWIVVVALVMLAAGLLGWWWWSRRAATPATLQPAATVLEPRPSASPSISPTPIDLPALDESDALLRRLAAGLVADPLWSEWLGAPRLVRTFTAAVSNVAEGASPRPHLAFLAPKGRFAVRSRGGDLVIDPASYGRYDPVARAVSALDAPAAVALYERVEPLFDAAYSDLGHPDARFRPVLGQAIARLLAVPRVDGEVRVRPVQRASLVYELADPQLESLSAAQKHLLRMGPANMGRVQEKLREIRERLAGVPAP